MFPNIWATLTGNFVAKTFSKIVQFDHTVPIFGLFHLLNLAGLNLGLVVNI